MLKISRKNDLPEIVWGVSPLLEGLLAPYAEKNNIPIIPFKQVEKRLPSYGREWKKKGGSVLRALTDLLQINFSEKTISVWVSGSIVGGQSAPLIVSANKNPDDVFDMVTHELIHRLAIRNSKHWSYESRLKKIISDKDRVFFNHAFVFAVHRFIFDNVMKDKTRLANENQKVKKYPSYAKAWEFVEQYGHKQLLKDLGFYLIK